MMYFCPCPCNSAIDPETEESTFLALPRNLSYVQESYLDCHSVSGRFVHNPKVDLAQQLKDQRTYRGGDPLEGCDVAHDEELGLLSNVRSSDVPFRYDASSSSAEIQLQSSLRSASSPIPVTTSPQKRPKLESPDGSALRSPGTGSFMSRVAASRLASFLSPKEEPSSFPKDYDSDFSSSVDQLPPQAAGIPNSDLDTRPFPEPHPQLIHSPDFRGLKMDRGEDHDACQATHVEDRIVSMDLAKSSSSPIVISTPGNGAEDVDEDNILSEDVNLDETSDNIKREGETWKTFSPTGKTMYPVKGHDDQFHPPPLTLIQDKDSSDISESQTTNCHLSPDSDAFSEEGVFVNMMDDLDTNEKSTTVSEVSDDTCLSVDSMFVSPDEEEDDFKEDCAKQQPEQSDQPRMSVEEAISRAASDLSKMSMMMYPDILDSPSTGDASVKVDGDSRRKLTRTSPLRQSNDLTVHLSYENLSSNYSSRNELEFPESPVYGDEEFNFNKKTLRKSSSLKTNKTPPGTPHRKKAVRFADAMGLDLESVRHVLNMESPPRIPPSAMADLRQGLGEDRKEVGPRYLCPCFTQPGALEGFVAKVLQQKISLENAIITDLTITGFVRVANICYHKSVRVRYTHNDWTTFHDIAASYVLSSCDGPTDRFSFSIVAPAYFVAGNRLMFALSFNADGTEYWDSNGGQNYSFECFAKPVPTDTEMSWMHFI